MQAHHKPQWLILVTLIVMLLLTKLRAQEVTVAKNMCIHNGAFVGVFDELTNNNDTLHNNGHLILMESSLNNQEPLAGVGTLEIEGEEQQDLFGQADIRVDTLLLNNSWKKGIGFDANIFIRKKADFINGILVDFDLEDYVNPRELFFVQFEEEAIATNVRNASHVEGTVKKLGTRDFLFPIGDRGWYRPLYCPASSEKELHTAKYFCCPNPFPEENVPEWVKLQREEYWFFESTQQKFILDISYSPNTSLWKPATIGELEVAKYDGLFETTNNVETEKTQEDVTVPSTEFKFYKTQVNNNNILEKKLDQPSIWYSFASKVTNTGGFFPELVTPNGDNSNDVWDVPPQYLTVDNEIKIFNRYGNTVFETKQYDNTWAGKANKPSLGGNDGYLPSGTYFVFFYAEGEIIYKGFFQLVLDK